MSFLTEMISSKVHSYNMQLCSLEITRNEMFGIKNMI